MLFKKERSIEMYAVSEVSDPTHLCPESCSQKNFQPPQSPHVSLLEPLNLDVYKNKRTYKRFDTYALSTFAFVLETCRISIN